MPKKCFLTLLRSDVYRPAAYSIVPYMFLHAYAVEELEGMPLMVACSRSVAALAVTIFHLGDSSRTSSHRDYLMLYICWVLAACGWINLLVPSGVDDVAQALAFGFSVGSWDIAYLPLLGLKEGHVQEYVPFLGLRRARGIVSIIGFKEGHI